MVGTTSRASTLVVWVAAALALAALVLVRPENSPAAHEDCMLSVSAPSSYGGIFTIASASVNCATTKNAIRVSVALTRDGAFVESSERTCRKRQDCPTYVVASDPPGDQVWCSRVSARVGTHSFREVLSCEAEAAP